MKKTEMLKAFAELVQNSQLNQDEVQEMLNYICKLERRGEKKREQNRQQKKSDILCDSKLQEIKKQFQSMVEMDQDKIALIKKRIETSQTIIKMIEIHFKWPT